MRRKVAPSSADGEPTKVERARTLCPMLDSEHALMLRGVANGIVDGKAPAPALKALIDAGLVEEQSGQSYVVTEHGRRVLALQH